MRILCGSILAAAAACMVLTLTASCLGNPIFDGWYADPQIRRYGDTWWVFPTMSGAFEKQLGFDAFSSKDMKTWTKHPGVLTTNDVAWAKGAMWAPDAHEVDGRYYIFFSANNAYPVGGKREDGEPQKEAKLQGYGGIGVAVAERPEGPYRDLIGKPLVDRFWNRAQPIDQYVFEYRGEWYMVYGGWGRCNLVKLAKGFKSLVPFEDGAMWRDMTPKGYVEGPVMFERDGRWYFMYSVGSWTGDDYCVNYSVGKSLFGPFEFKGKVLGVQRPIATGAGHHSVARVPGTDEWYICYHRRPIPNEGRDHRVVCIDRMEFDANGDIKPVVMTQGQAQECVAAESPVSAVSRMESRTQDPTRDPGLFGDYWWANRFLSRSRLVEGFRGKTVDVVMLGDSIMHFWEWKHPASWAKFTKGRTVLNLGYGGDKTQNVLWRMEHGELDGYTAKCVVLMIGTNNNSANDSDPAAVAEGVKKIVAGIRSRQPTAKVILHPIFPRGCSADSTRHAAARSRNDKTNALLKQFAEEDGKLVWVDFNDKLIDESGWVPKSLMADEIHPTDAGYDIWMDALVPHLVSANAASAEVGWRVSVNGREIPLRTCRAEVWAPYAFGSFVVAGGEQVAVTSPDGSVERFVAEKPFCRIFDPDHRKSVLVLFGDTPETDVPDRNDPKVKWFGPGEHHAGGISLKDGETLYLERGAIVYGGLYARGRDITVAGRGILTGADYPKCKGPFPFFTYFDHCTNLVVRGVTLTEPYHWTLAVSQSRKVLIEDVRLCAGNIINDDGIDLMNTSEATIRNVFVRTQDDAIAVKGMDFRPPAERSPCEDILVENCTLWVDSANVFRIGFESNASAFRRMTFRGIYVHAYSHRCLPVSHEWAHAVVWLQPSNGLKISDVLFEDLHVRSDGTDMPLVIAEPRLTRCFRLGSGKDPYSGKVEREFYKTGGSVDGVTFRRMTVDGVKGAFHGIVHAKGRSPSEAVSNLCFENCARFGEPLTAKSPYVTVGEFSSVRFAAGR